VWVLAVVQCALVLAVSVLLTARVWVALVRLMELRLSAKVQVLLLVLVEFPQGIAVRPLAGLAALPVRFRSDLVATAQAEGVLV